MVINTLGVGVKIKIYNLGGGLVEFMAIGTAVKKMAGVGTRTPLLIPQAIIQDRDTFVDDTDVGGLNLDVGRGAGAASARRLQRGPLSVIFFIFVVLFYLFRIFGHLNH